MPDLQEASVLGQIQEETRFLDPQEEENQESREERGAFRQPFQTFPISI